VGRVGSSLRTNEGARMKEFTAFVGSCAIVTLMMLIVLAGWSV